MSQIKRGQQSRIMYIENKSQNLDGEARIGRVTQTASTLAPSRC